MEFLLANHPLDCPICDQGGECDLQDQSMRYGADRSRFHEITGKRAVENKDLGPLVKTSMNRCIQCTRCVRFANEVAGVEDLGTTGRGNDMQIGMYVEKTMNSELSGNIVDLCPVGALTSKPYSYTARPWELKSTESVDVLDAVGSNIRIDSRGVQVMRIQPRTNDDVNEEWISDKTRYAYDGLRFQRLTTPLVKQGDRFVPATWENALTAIVNGLEASGAKDNEIQAIAGHLADTESLVALKDLTNKLGSDNLALDQVGGNAAPVYGVDIRSNYLFNSTIPGVEKADAILLVGTNPRHEAAVLNSRIRKSWLHTPLEVGLIGERIDTTYGYDYLGDTAKAVQEFVEGKGEFAKKFQAAKKPLIIVGSAVASHPDGEGVHALLAKFVEQNKEKLVTDEWNGFNVLQRVRIICKVSANLRMASNRNSVSTHTLCRSHPDPQPTTSASHQAKPPRRPRPSSSTFSTRTRSPPSPSPRTRSSSTRATTATSAHSSRTSSSLALHTPRRARRGSTPRAARSSGAQPSRPPAHRARTGRSSVRFQSSSARRCRMMMYWRSATACGRSHPIWCAMI